MKLILNISFSIIALLSILNAQVKPAITPLSKLTDNLVKTEIKNSDFVFSTKNRIEQYSLNLGADDLYIFSKIAKNTS